MAKAWVHQRPAEVAKKGEAKAPWCVSYYDPGGKRKLKSCGPGIAGKRAAEKLAEKLSAELLTGTYDAPEKVTWDEFIEEYERRVLAGLAPRTLDAAKTSLEAFKRVCKPKKLVGINTRFVADFVADRRKEGGRRQGDVISPATINKDLRHLKAALASAKEWGYISEVPKIRMERESKKLPTFVSPEHFAAIYAAADSARLPAGLPNTSATAWWRAFLVFGYMTGWRLNELLSLARADVDLTTGHAITRATSVGNKGKRDERVKLHDVVIEHFRTLGHFADRILPWDYDERTIFSEFARIQEAAGIKLPCAKTHKHGQFCYLYGFHDLRRAFATMNAPRLSADDLQHLMRHKSYETTKRYVNMASRLDDSAGKLFVPDVLKPTIADDKAASRASG